MKISKNLKDQTFVEFFFLLRIIIKVRNSFYKQTINYLNGKIIVIIKTVFVCTFSTTRKAFKSLMFEYTFMIIIRTAILLQKKK